MESFGAPRTIGPRFLRRGGADRSSSAVLEDVVQLDT